VAHRHQLLQPEDMLQTEHMVGSAVNHGPTIFD
jgi:hypothetical protein